jgi:hypothetical protein
MSDEFFGGRGRTGKPFPDIYIIFTIRFLSAIARQRTADYYAPSIDC